MFPLVGVGLRVVGAAWAVLRMKQRFPHKVPSRYTPERSDKTFTDLTTLFARLGANPHIWPTVKLIICVDDEIFLEFIETFRFADSSEIELIEGE